MSIRIQRLAAAAAVGIGLSLSAGTALGQNKGPSTGSTPYAVPVAPNVRTYSIATVDNVSSADDTFNKIGGGTYGMVGVPDGLGAFDNGDRTFTVLMNHEIGATSGVVRDHGTNGSFVSRWIINKDTLAVVGAKDLIQNLNLWNGTGYTTFNTSNPLASGAGIGRLCSADLAPVTAFSNGAVGTPARLFLSGEETGAEGRVFAHIASGANAGSSYELPRLGKFSWENAVASPFQQNKTVVIGTDDSTPGQVYVYVGNKTGTGTEVDKAGLTNGALYGIKIPSAPLEDTAANAARNATPFGIGKGGSTAFSLQIKNTTGDVSGLTGAQIQADSAANAITEFLRPEDGAWDTKNANRFYFVTTDRYDQVKDGTGSQIGRSRLWALDFTDITNPTSGGQIKLLLDGSESLANGGLNMMDNIGVDKDGNVIIVEDVGGNAHNGKIARYNPTTGNVEILAKHDTARFGDIGTGATAPFSNDEEFSGVIDVTDIMSDSLLRNGLSDERWYLFDDQAHYGAGTTAQVEGGQLLIMAVPEPGTLCFVGGMIGMATLRRRRRR
ncbi:alkaline phosphatase PhoX [Humisphaera borealis]|uniref:DUF839 domain-containing protein n=1 Tax=Humisphaera borealis TaxID=2807512 RepID=A0A7M2WSC0_9BACT|nr:alkaline phosphatase PhoX [Humisphaera borealis]QOV87691.1 DUF839 domain-containing protein [Humisphaera borealis]